MSTTPPLGLRERKKVHTREQLADTALRLFTENGFDATTLDEVVEQVQVSKRTFFRTYASKESVALEAEQQLLQRYVYEIGDRPLHGPLLEFYLEALQAALADMDDSWYDRLARARRLAEVTPSLLAHSLRQCADASRDVVLTLGARLNYPQFGDDRLQLPFEVALVAWRSAMTSWLTAGEAPDPEALSRQVDAAFALVIPSLAAELTPSAEV